jgi:hydrogenase maturation factor
MEIKQNSNLIDVYGVIKTIQDSQELISAIKNASKSGSIIIRINDSFSIPSTVIGELLKIKDSGVDIGVEVKDDILYELLDDLNLVSTFNVRKF